MLQEKILLLKQSINSVGSSQLLDYVKTEFIEKIELESSKDPVFSSAFIKLSGLVEKCIKCIADYNSIAELKNAYSEAYIYSKLKSLLVIEKVPERSSKTPDFKIIFSGLPIYIEMKSFNMVDGIVKDKMIMDEALDSRIKMEKQIKAGRTFAISEQLIQPYRASDKPYDPETPKTIIQALIDKVLQNLKQEQFNQDNTILLIDLGNGILPVPFPRKAINEFYDQDGYKVSGALWHTAFRSINSIIYRVPEFKGSPITEELDREGILNSSSFVKGLIFHIYDEFYALAKNTDGNTTVVNMMSYLCPYNSKFL